MNRSNLKEKVIQLIEKNITDGVLDTESLNAEFAKMSLGDVSPDEEAELISIIDSYSVGGN